MATKKLYRSETDRMIAGVCGGLGEYFDVDPVVVRLLFVVFALAGGSAIFLYIILWVIMPSKSSATTDSSEVVTENVKEMKKKITDTASAIKEGVKSKQD